MDIRSQNKKMLINSNLVPYLEADEAKGKIFVTFSEGHYFSIGEYRTMDRALEVLDEIQRHKHELKTPVYQMPEE